MWGLTAEGEHTLEKRTIWNQATSISLNLPSFIAAPSAALYSKLGGNGSQASTPLAKQFFTLRHREEPQSRGQVADIDIRRLLVGCSACRFRRKFTSFRLKVTRWPDPMSSTNPSRLR